MDGSTLSDLDLARRAMKEASRARKDGMRTGNLRLWEAGLRAEHVAARALENEPRRTIAVSSVVKAREEDRFLLCVVYSPNRMPLRGADQRVDLATPDVLEKACWRFAMNGFKVGVDHKPGGEGAARVVENWIHRGPSWHLIGPDGRESVVKAGDWIVGMVLSPSAWRSYKAGRFGGVSMQGRAERIPATKKTLNRVKAG